MKRLLVSTHLLAWALVWIPAAQSAVRVWQKVEITLEAQRDYDNPYTEVEVWVDLEGPGFAKRCYGFWDGGSTFKVRVMATRPGRWSWTSGSSPADPGLDGQRGEMTAEAWTEGQKQANPLRRGMIVASANGHALEHADGTPFIVIGDTWWSAATFRFPWYDDDRERPIGPDAGIKDYVRLRQQQGFNLVGMIAAFPNWADDGKPWVIWLDRERNLGVRSAWVHQQEINQGLPRERWRAKDMHNEGGRAFFFPGKVPGYEDVYPDLDRINPEYFRHLDRKIDYLNEQGFVVFLEVARRDCTSAWGKYHEWPESYSRYVQYIWSRYQANICIYSPIHYDWVDMAMTERQFNEAANLVIERYGPPPFGTLVSCNSSLSSQANFGRFPDNEWLTLQQIGNWREHDHYWYLTEIFHTEPPRPALNGEPYYSGYKDKRNFTYQHGAEGGTERDDLYVRSAMYGSFLSGGLGGQIYGAEGIWGGDVEEGSDPAMWEAFQWSSAEMMRHLRTFALGIGERYQDLVPDANLVTPNRTHEVRAYTGWAYCARTPDKRLFLAYYEQGCPNGVVRGALPGETYETSWFDPRKCEWIPVGPTGALEADRWGRIEIPEKPTGSDWGLRLEARPATQDPSGHASR